VKETVRSVVIRDSVEADLVTIQDIYAYHVEHGTASFELTAPSLNEMAQRRADIVAKHLPYLVAEIDGVVVGYAYATMYRPRPAYRFTVEDSVYVRQGLSRSGYFARSDINLVSGGIRRCSNARWARAIQALREMECS
jgi:phosphinothricin acetyltransferase